jgi:ferredoxin-NADP reductase
MDLKTRGLMKNLSEITDFKKHFYICGPYPMVSELVSILQKTGATTDTLVFEK